MTFPSGWLKPLNLNTFKSELVNTDHPNITLSHAFALLCVCVCVCVCVSVCDLTCARLFETSWTVVHQALLSIGFSRQEYWNRLSFPFPEILLTQELNCISYISCKGEFFTTSATFSVNGTIIYPIYLSQNWLLLFIYSLWGVKLLYKIFYICYTTSISSVDKSDCKW